jgi:hypothetical protein
MKKPFTLLAVREARKKLVFVLPADSRVHNNFAEQRRCCAERQATAESWGQLSLRLEDDVQEAV